MTTSRSPAAILVFTHAHIPLLAALTVFSAGIALAIALALVGGYRVPVAVVGLTAATLVLVVLLELWTAQRLLRSGAA